MKILKFILSLFFLILGGCGSMEKTNEIEPNVLLLSTFHFSNPKKDLVKNEVIDVMSNTSQQYLNQLAKKLEGFNPTVILLEFPEKSDTKINDRYQRFLNNQYELKYNEIEQIGFRVGKLSNLEKLHGFDEREIKWQGQKLSEQLSSTPKIKERFDAKIKSLTRTESEDHKKLSLRQLLKKYNSRKSEKFNKSLYITTNSVGAGKDFVGADATASWWHRNFRMLSHIQKYVNKGERVLVIGGQGHIAIIRDLLELDATVIQADPQSYL